MAYAPDYLLTEGVQLTSAESGSRMKTAATWLFVLPLFTEGVLPGVVKLQMAGLAVLAFGRIAVVRRALPPRALERIYLVFAALALTVITYLALRPWPQFAGSIRSYDTRAVMFVITYTAVAVFAVLFLEEQIFVRVMWRSATIALWAGVLTCLVSRISGYLIRVNPANSALRMTGTLFEPSAWAPILVMVLLLALRRRSRLYVFLSLAGLYLADSPTCMLVMAVTVPLYYALTGKWRHRVVLLAALCILIPAGAFFVSHADVPAYMDSRNASEVAAGRLVSGIRNISTDGQQGYNSRFVDTTGALDAARANGWMVFGAGPAADATYFTAAGTQAAAGVNALWVSVLVDFGAGGTILLGVLIVTAVWRMRRFPPLAAILIPSCVASLVNSSIPDWSFAALAVIMFTPGRASPAASRPPLPAGTYAPDGRASADGSVPSWRKMTPPTDTR